MGEVCASEFPAGRWQARWIWSHVPHIARSGSLLAPRIEREPSWACFRRTFELAEVPVRVPARLTADSRYVLWVNGRELSRGPVRSNLRRLHYDLLDLAPVLRPGRNAVAVLARHFGMANPWWAPAPAGLHLGAGALLFEARLEGTDYLVSDAEWRTLESRAWQDIAASGMSAGAMPSECHDARLLAADWTAPGFDDTSWDQATALGANSLGFDGRHEPPNNPYGPLLPRPIALLDRKPRAGKVTRVAAGQGAGDEPTPFLQALADSATGAPLQTADLPLTLSGTDEGVAVTTVDFGEVVAGTVELVIDAPPGARVDVAAVEFVGDDGAPQPDGEQSGFRYVARGEDDRYETMTPFGLRALTLAVRSQRPVVLRSLTVNERLHPRATGPFFECSDPRLEQIWAVGRRSVDLNSHDAYLDCPTREQRAWSGDFVVHQMVDLVSHPDWRLARWNVELCASPRPDGMLPMAAAGDIEHGDASYIPDWALHWIRALHNLYRYTGDRDLVARLLPVAEGVLRWFLPFQAEDGLLTDVTGWLIIDWSSVTVTGKSSVLNALWARGLRDFAEMAEWLGDQGRAGWARSLHGALFRAFDLFWDPQRWLYVDHALGSERGRPVSQHAQAAPLAAGLVPGERVDPVVEAMLDEKRLVHATWSRASGDAREPREGEQGVGGSYLLFGPPTPWWDQDRQMVRAQPFFRYVVHDALAETGRADRIASLCLDWVQLLERCPTSWSETWYGGTVSHGWCSTPTRDLLTRTLGVTPAEPGFGRARVAPRLGELAWARGAVPTAQGLLTVRVDSQGLEVESPVPFELDLGDGRVQEHASGSRRIDTRAVRA